MYDLNTYTLEQNRRYPAPSENRAVTAGMRREGLPESEARRIIDEAQPRKLPISVPQLSFLRGLGSRMRARIWHAEPSAGLR